MANCINCGKEIEDSTRFCQFCGTNQVEEPNNTKKKRWIFGLIGMGLVLVLGVVLYFFSFDDINQFNRFLGNGNYEQASAIYAEEIESDKKKVVKVKSTIIEEANKIASEFENEKIKYEDAKKALDNLSDYDVSKTEIGQVKFNLTSLHKSREAYRLGNEYAKNEEWADALLELEKVIEEDKNYKEVQTIKEEYLEKLKETNTTLARDAYEKQDFKEAISLMEDLAKFFPEEAEFKVKKEQWKKEKDEVEKVAREKEMEKLKKEQELEVVNTTIIHDWLRDEMAEVLVKNNTDKVVKEYEVGIMAYDANGYPIKVGWLTEAYEMKGTGEANIQAGETFGHNKGWELGNEDAVTILACVISAKYYDGSTWNNPYYQYWRKNHHQVPLN